jgi:phage terminase small subunit
VAGSNSQRKQAGKGAPAPADPHGLTARQRLFVSAYLGPAKGNATQAAIAAGYSPDTAASQGSRLLKNAKVSAAVEQRTERLLKRHEVTADRILQELAHVAFLDPAELAGEQGTLRELASMPEHVRRAVESLEVRPDGTVKLVPSNKLKALELLGKSQKLFTDKVEHDVSETLGELVAGSMRPKEGA